MQAGTDSRSVQELLIYAEVATTMIKTHVLQMDGGAQSAGLVVQHLGAAKQSLVNFCTQPMADLQFAQSWESNFKPSGRNSPLGDTCRYSVCRVMFISAHRSPTLVSG